MRRIAAATLVALLVSACASSPKVPDGEPRITRNVITHDEIVAADRPGGTAWDLVSRMRPQFLSSRGVNSFRDGVSRGPVVYLDGSRYGETESLKTISADQVMRVEFMSGPNATTRYGMDHAGGAILITTH
jgi:hypothetical protein